MTIKQIISELKESSNSKNREGMAKYGINTESSFGVPIPSIRKIAKEIDRNHQLALELWGTGIHEARILAGMIDEPAKVTKEQMNNWVKDFNSWDVCDQTCNNLFGYTTHSFVKAIEWAAREEEYIKRAGFVLMAVMAVHSDCLTDDDFKKFFPIIKKESVDERNFVKKSVNWALRQIGKRNINLNKHAIELSKKIIAINSKSARWIGADALRELTNDKIQIRLNRKLKPK